MSEIRLKFFISTLPLTNRSGFKTGGVMGSRVCVERASGHPVSLLRLGQRGILGLQPHDWDGEGLWRWFPWASGAGCCTGTIPGAASSPSGSVCKHPENV